MLEEGRINYIIMVLLTTLPTKTLPLEMKNYMSTYTYVDARKYKENLQHVRKRIRFAMPKLTLDQTKVGSISISQKTQHFKYEISLSPFWGWLILPT